MSISKQHPNLDVYAIPVTPATENDFTDDRTGKNVDLTTFTMYEWSHSIRETGAHGCDLLECKYGWCSCFVIAQIESRIGKASYNAALCFHIGILVVVTLVAVIGVVWFICVDQGAADSDSPFTMIWAIGGSAILIIGVFLEFFSQVLTRSEVRKMFQIPEGQLTDCYMMKRRHHVRALRQMALHLKIDQAGIFDRVDTLPAYQE